METKKKHLKLLHVGYMSFLVMFLINNSASGKDYPERTQEDSSGISAYKWHPEMFYIELPDLSMTFMLPHEPEQSGVHNLFFISKESGETYLLDTIKDNKRFFTPFSAGDCFDVVLLYNNCKYVKCNNIILENGLEVDMRNIRIRPSDSISEYWKKTFRAFDYAIVDRDSDRNNGAASEYVTKGYVFSNRIDNGVALGGASPEDGARYVSINAGGKRVRTTADGYFEIDNIDDTQQALLISAALHSTFKKSNLPASCGLVIVLSIFGKARREP